jgi:hypothetical protein
MNNAITVEKHEDGYNVTFEASRRELFVGAINGKFTLELTKEQAKILSNALYTPKTFVPKVKKEVEATTPVTATTATNTTEVVAEVKKPKRAPRKKPVSTEKTIEAEETAPARKYTPRSPKGDK